MSYVHEGPNKADKGQRGGSCNRTACQRPGATWYNSSTRAWYCKSCALKINYWSLRDHGEEICAPDESLTEVQP